MDVEYNILECDRALDDQAVNAAWMGAVLTLTTGIHPKRTSSTLDKPPAPFIIGWSEGVGNVGP